MKRFVLFVMLVFVSALNVRAQGDGARLAFVSRTPAENDLHYTVQIYDFATQEITDIAGMQFDYASDLTWSADGKLAFVGRKNIFEYGVYVWDGTLQTIAEGASGYSGLAWSSDGKLALVEWQDGHVVQVWDGTALSALCTRDENCSQPVWNDENVLAFTAPDGAIYNYPCGDCDRPADEPSGIRIWKNGEISRVVDPVAAGLSARNPYWSPDGLLFTMKQGETMSLASGANDTITSLYRMADGAYYWHPYGDLAIVSTPLGPGMVNLDVLFGAASADDAPEAKQVLEDAGMVSDVTWSYDGRLAFSAETATGGGVFVWNGTEMLPVGMPSDTYNEGNPAWSFYGELTFSAGTPGDDGDIFLWDGMSTTARLINLPDTVEGESAWWTPLPE